jgi:DNA mismatch repair protein MutL
MGKINRLPSDLANQIAAGEVVERPASVVKELVENAVDAGARRLAIHIELGGKKLVRVEDDGEGMDPEDARLALERHATSKITRADDLAAILSGFRAAAVDRPVSHFVLHARARRRAGRDSRATAASRRSPKPPPRRTVVEVAISSTPRRRGGSLKSERRVDAVSRGHLWRWRIEIGFHPDRAGRTMLQCPPTASCAIGSSDISASARIWWRSARRPAD